MKYVAPTLPSKHNANLSPVLHSFLKRVFSDDDNDACFISSSRSDGVENAR